MGRCLTGRRPGLLSCRSIRRGRCRCRRLARRFKTEVAVRLLLRVDAETELDKWKARSISDYYAAAYEDCAPGVRATACETEYREGVVQDWLEGDDSSGLFLMAMMFPVAGPEDAVAMVATKVIGDRIALIVPQVAAGGRLQNILDNLYKGVKSEGRVGNGPPWMP